jgi:uncharacterized OB-fold protein
MTTTARNTAHEGPGDAGRDGTAPGGSVHDRIAALGERLIGAGEGPEVAAPDPVNLPMIRHWTQAMGDANPLYTDAEFAASTSHGGIVAPPAMIQVWTMPGLDRSGQARTPVDDLLAALNQDGFTGVVATNCEQSYRRHLRPGERPVARTRLTDLAGPKRTALGEGYFVTWNVTWYADGEPVAEMLFRVLKFRPRERRTTPEGRAPYPLKPAINKDTEFFWDGVRDGELRIQKCGGCGELRHPPGPVCPSCRSHDRTHVVASGVGEVYSFVVHHNPPVPGLDTPFVVAVVELPEGVRIVGNIVDCAPSDVGIGMPLRVTYRQMDDDLFLPIWVPRES